MGIKEIAGQNKNLDLGDTMLVFAEKAIKHGMYKLIIDDRGFCYSIF